MGNSLKTLVLTLAVSASAVGCATSHVRTAGDPVLVTPAGGSLISSVVTTPGTAGARPMISASVDPAVDAIAVLEANRGFEGRVLGPASPGAGTAVSQRVATGQFISPAVNLATAGAVIGSQVAGSNAGAVVNPAIGVGANFGVTGLSNATATRIAGTTTPGTNMTAATIAGEAVVPVPGTRLNVDNAAVVATRSGPRVRVETAPRGGTVVTNTNP